MTIGDRVRFAGSGKKRANMRGRIVGFGDRSIRVLVGSKFYNLSEAQIKEVL